jgi:hypothetical protein
MLDLELTPHESYMNHPIPHDVTVDGTAGASALKNHMQLICLKHDHLCTSRSSLGSKVDGIYLSGGRTCDPLQITAVTAPCSIYDCSHALVVTGGIVKEMTPIHICNPYISSPRKILHHPETTKIVLINQPSNEIMINSVYFMSDFDS